MKSMLIATALVLTGCSTATTEEKTVGMANPASEYCVKIGGKLEIRKEPAGEAGYCHLPDGRVIDEWQLYRSAHSDKGA